MDFDSYSLVDFDNLVDLDGVVDFAYHFAGNCIRFSDYQHSCCLVVDRLLLEASVLDNMDLVLHYV